MAATKGRALRVKVSAVSGGPFAVVAGVKSASMSRAGQNVDVSTLTDGDVVRLQGIRDATYSLSGQWETDADGQGAIREALELDDATLFVQFLPNGTVGFQQEVKVAKYDISGATADVLAVSIELEGSGAVTAIGA